MTAWDRDTAKGLALLADANREVARTVRPWLMTRGLDLVHARAGLAALELLQRMPESFVLALISLRLPDLPGAVLLETLRLFRPDLPIVCLDDASAALADDPPCLSKPIQQGTFNSQVVEAMERRTVLPDLAVLPAESIARAKASFAVSGSLLDAARELSRGNLLEGPDDEPPQL